MKPRALIAEFIGTFALIYVGVLSIHHLGGAPAGLIGIALAHGLVIACFASATDATSGGHLNPAVTFAFLLVRRISPGAALGYILAQCAGAFAAAFAAMVCVPGSPVEMIRKGTPALGDGISLGQGILMEAITTFFLVFVIFGTAVDRRGPKMGALFIGLTVTLCIFAIGPFTGAALNPARWFGPALAGGKWDGSLAYIAGPLIGGTIAAFVYAVMLLDKEPLAPDAPVRVDPEG